MYRNAILSCRTIRLMKRVIHLALVPDARSGGRDERIPLTEDSLAPLTLESLAYD